MNVHLSLVIGISIFFAGYERAQAQASSVFGFVNNTSNDQYSDVRRGSPTPAVPPVLTDVDLAQSDWHSHGVATPEFRQSECCCSGCNEVSCGGCSLCSNSNACPCCDDCWLGYRGAGCGGAWVRTEALMLAYHRSDGVRVGDEVNEWVNSSFNLVPRLTLGYTGCEGTGMRVRWFDYNHNERSVANVQGEFLSVDTFNLDLEVFDNIRLNRNWSLEVSGGYRFNNFSEWMVDMNNPNGENEQRENSSTTQGGIFGLEVRRDYCRCSLYGGLRGSILMGDKQRSNVASGHERFGDVIQSIWEINFGIEKSWCIGCGSLAYIRLGGEWQQWENFSSNFTTDPTPPPPNPECENQWGGHSDVGFAGFTFAAGVIR